MAVVIAVCCGMIGYQLAAAPLELVRSEDVDGNGVDEIVVENEFYRLVIDSARGASAVSFIAKPSKTELLLPDAKHGVGLFGDVVDGEAIGGQWQGARPFGLPCFGIIRVRPQFTDGLSAFVIRIKLGFRKGPTAQRNPFTFFKVNVVEGTAVSRPMVGRTTKVP